MSAHPSGKPGLPSAGLFSFGWIPVWRRNFLVWRKLAFPSLLGNLADPLIYMLGLGYGLGRMLPRISGVDYMQFLIAGMIVASAMNAATFESLYSAFSRMRTQKTWDAILVTPLSLDDVLAGELFWAASKSFLSGFSILLVISALGLSSLPLALWVLPIIFLTGFAFAAIGLVVCALAPSYDFFMYYFTLFITPMLMISGIFFPVENLPHSIYLVASWLPLSHAVRLVRPLLLGECPQDIVLHVAVLLGVTIVAFRVAVFLTRRRLLN
ncbi:MAG: ABC transporter permease [Candidatus Accumulibacter sp.]|jgi:lipooligosaccharide transport system permease protein|nr:ABC transporter permease [Accumulibacter sp.]